MCVCGVNPEEARDHAVIGEREALVPHPVLQRLAVRARVLRVFCACVCARARACVRACVIAGEREGL